MSKQRADLGAGQGHWFPDPTGRNDRRYWDGRVWTDQIRSGGIQATDPISRGYAGPDEFRFRESNGRQLKAPETRSAAWRDAFGVLHGSS